MLSKTSGNTRVLHFLIFYDISKLPERPLAAQGQKNEFPHNNFNCRSHIFARLEFFGNLQTLVLTSPTIETHVFYDTFASPTIATHVFYDTFASPSIEAYVFYETFESYFSKKCTTLDEYRSGASPVARPCPSLAARLGSPETSILATPLAKSTKKYPQRQKSARLLHLFSKNCTTL